jgi:cob(I)alamin adenosyltransferase
MIHIYTGDGKGKTTAAMGLALRAAGSGKTVVIVQCMKGSDSGEISVLRTIANISVLRNAQDYGFFSRTDKASQEKIIAENNENLRAVFDMPWDLLVLDEAIGAYSLGALDKALIDRLIAQSALDKEIVLTGRDPPRHLIDAADYVSEIRKVKHPFERGIKARRGVEY